jgi:hypothetical protein
VDALHIVSNCHLGDGNVVCALRYHLEVCPANIRPLTCECGTPFSPRQAMRCRCCAGADLRTGYHDVAVECGLRACVEKSAQACSRELAVAHLQGDVVWDPALVNGKRVDFRVFDTSGSVGCDVTIVDSTCPSYLGKYSSVVLRYVRLGRVRLGSMC